MKALLFLLLAAFAVEVAADPQSPSIEGRERAAADDKVTAERWNFAVDGRPWDLASVSLNGSAVIRTYVPKGRSLADTKERLITEYGGKTVPRELFEQFQAGMSEACPSLKILPISEDEDSIFFEWSCRGDLAQHALKRIESTGEHTYIISFSRKGKLSAKLKKTWVAILEAAKPQ